MSIGSPFLKYSKTDYACSRLYEQWDCEKMGPIEISLEDVLGNGHHRSLTLVCLMLQDKVQYEPVKFVLTHEASVGHAYVYGCRPVFDADLALARKFQRLEDARFREAAKAGQRRDTAEVKGLLVKMDTEEEAVDMDADVFRPFD